MIKATLQGRRLVLSVETGDDEEAVEPFVVAPLSAREGRELSIRYVFATEGLPTPGGSVQQDMIDSFGVANYQRADEELRAEEMEMMLQAAYFWQSVGGMDSVRGLLELDEEGQQGGDAAKGKALTAFQLRTAPLLSQIRHRLESVRRIPAESTPDTTTRNGSDSSASAPASKPNAKPKPRSRKKPASRTSSSASPATTD